MTSLATVLTDLGAFEGKGPAHGQALRDALDDLSLRCTTQIRAATHLTTSTVPGIAARAAVRVEAYHALLTVLGELG